MKGAFNPASVVKETDAEPASWCCDVCRAGSEADARARAAADELSRLSMELGLPE
jgi:hypothetical protein